MRMERRNKKNYIIKPYHKKNDYDVEPTIYLIKQEIIAYRNIFLIPFPNPLLQPYQGKNPKSISHILIISCYMDKFIRKISSDHSPPPLVQYIIVTTPIYNSNT